MKCVALVFHLALLTSNHNNNLHKISKEICYYSKLRNLDPVMILSIIKHESDFISWKKSSTNDFGLMQVHSKSKFGSTYLKGRKCNLLKIRCNIKWGTYIMYIWKKKRSNGI